MSNRGGIVFSSEMFGENIIKDDVRYKISLIIKRVTYLLKKEGILLNKRIKICLITPRIRSAVIPKHRIILLGDMFINSVILETVMYAVLSSVLCIINSKRYYRFVKSVELRKIPRKQFVYRILQRQYLYHLKSTRLLRMNKYPDDFNEFAKNILSIPIRGRRYALQK